LGEFGVAAIAVNWVSVHTRIAAEREPTVIPIHDGAPEAGEEFSVDFAIPLLAPGITCVVTARLCCRFAMRMPRRIGANVTVNRAATPCR
jgi:hypothetical protein